MKSRIEEIDQYFNTNGRLIAHDQKWLIAEHKQMASTQRVIRTWASVDGALIPDQVRKACDRALNP